jgi:hypothetical protein
LFKKNTFANFFAISFVTSPKLTQMPRERTFPTPALNRNSPREHRFYAQLIPWLQPLFAKISVDKLQLLSESSYLYFKFLLSIDDFIDDGFAVHNVRELDPSFSNHVLAIRYLASLFPEEPFWNTFSDVRKKYFDVLHTEKILSEQKNAYDMSLFETIAKGKSIMCHNTIYALQYLANDANHEKSLIEVLNHIHIAFQCLDDIDDFNKDRKHGQWTYVQSLVRSYCQENQLDWSNDALAHKCLFLSGIAHKFLDKAQHHYQEALHITDKLGLDELSSYLKKQINHSRFFGQEIDYLVDKTKVISQLSQNTLSNGDVFVAQNKALSFLSQWQAPDGTWTDFMTSAGSGKAWITGYVTAQLAECTPEISLLSETKQVLANQDAFFLSFNDSIFQDGDSTTFVLYSQWLTHVAIDTTLHRWLPFQNEQGGWSTYLDPQALRTRLDIPEDISVQAWITPKLCVSAVATFVLKKLSHPAFSLSRDYLLQNQQPDGSWLSYWWTSNVYATAWAILALEKHSLEIQKACHWLISQQKEEGFWENPTSGKPNAFYTALALKALMRVQNADFKWVIDRGIQWILQNQTSDGSWMSDRILRIPATDIHDPNLVHT